MASVEKGAHRLKFLHVKHTYVLALTEFVCTAACLCYFASLSSDPERPEPNKILYHGLL